jgi:cbb3-type cytochrome oxidase cytochrome c subunit
MKFLIFLFAVQFFISALASAKCYVVRDNSDPTKWAVIGAEGFIPPNSYDCPAGAESDDGDAITVSNGKATLNQTKKSARKAAEAQARATQDLADQAKKRARADAKAVDPTKIKTLDDAVAAIQKLQKAVE